MASSFFTMTALVVFAVVLVVATVALRRRAQNHNLAIGAEVWADDVLESYSGQETQKQTVPQQPAPTLVYRWDRIAIFGFGLLSLAFALITGVLFLFTSASWVLPVLGLIGAGASFAVLRYLALEDAKKRAKERRAQKKEDEASQLVLKPAPKTRVSVGTPASASGAHQVKPIKHGQQKPVNYASKSLRYARTHHQPAQKVEFAKLPSGSIKLEKQEAITSAAQTWEVRETPRPTYLDAQVSFRQEGEQMVMAEPVKAESASIKEAAEKAMNLDDVLSRRRAS